MRFVIVLVALVAAAACSESELSVAGTTTDLPARFDGEDTYHAFTVRNVGDGSLTLDAVTFSEDSEGNFFGVDVDVSELLAGDQAVIGFFYRTPGGIAQAAVLNIASTATVNPSVDVDLSTESAVDGPDAGLPDAADGIDAGDGPDAGGLDAGTGLPDAADGIDAGPADAALVDAGTTDAG